MWVKNRKEFLIGVYALRNYMEILLKDLQKIEEMTPLEKETARILLQSAEVKTSGILVSYLFDTKTGKPKYENVIEDLPSCGMSDLSI